jgi:hypothetical protein
MLTAKTTNADEAPRQNAGATGKSTAYGLENPYRTRGTQYLAGEGAGMG